MADYEITNKSGRPETFSPNGVVTVVKSGKTETLKGVQFSKVRIQQLAAKGIIVKQVPTSQDTPPAAKPAPVSKDG